jgi:hypothetical protein
MKPDWGRQFEGLIELPNCHKLITLRDAANAAVLSSRPRT